MYSFDLLASPSKKEAREGRISNRIPLKTIEERSEWLHRKAEQNGFIVHTSGKKIGFGDLALAASKLKVPDKVELKNKKDFKLIGQTFAGVDNKDLFKLN